MELSPLIISLKTASLSIVLTFFLGLLAAWLVLQIQQEWGKILLDGLFTLPMVLPPTVVGFFLLYLLGVKRPIGRFFLEYFGFRIAFSWEATVIAAVIMSFPLMYRSARGAMEQVDDTLVQAARTLGMSEWKIFRKVLCANALPGILGGGVLAFARGLGEFGATAMLAGNIAGKTQTLPIAVYSEVAAGNMEEAGGYVVIMAAAAFLAIAVMDLAAWNKQRRYSREGR